MDRHHTTILVADLVGYSRHMGENEAFTFKEISALLKEIIEPKIAQHDGRIIKLMGDGILAVFDDGVKAVSFARETQENVLQRNQTRQDNHNFSYRIGINSGDVIHDNRDIYGDGVNVAARLEGIAPEGGLCVSDIVYEEVRNQLPIPFKDCGNLELKNIAHPVHVWGWHPDEARAMPDIVDGTAADMVLPEKPSVAILPLVNLSGNANEEYLADQFTENIIFTLSTSPHLTVISRNSSFTFKGQNTLAQDVGKKLGVQHLVEGSFQSEGTQMRISVNLIDTKTGHHLWSERFDRERTDLFQVQDEVSHRIAVELNAKLSLGDLVRHRSWDSKSFQLFADGRIGFNLFTPEGFQTASKCWKILYEQAPEHPESLCLMGWLDLHEVIIGQSSDPLESFEKARNFANQAMNADPGHGNIYRLLGTTETWAGNYSVAEKHIDRAIELEPSNGEAVSISGLIRLFSGKTEEAVALLLQAMKLEPYYPLWVSNAMGYAKILLGQLDEARAIYRKMRKSDAESFVQQALVMLAYIENSEGYTIQSEEHMKELVSKYPNATRETLYNFNLKMFADQSWPNKVMEILKSNGVPEN